MELINETGLKLIVAAGDPEDPDVRSLILLKGTFKLVPDGPCTPLPEAEQRETQGDELHQDDLGRTPSWATDFAPFKPHTDCFVLGTAHAPGGVPVPSFRAGFRLGPISKDVQLWGPRHWTKSGMMSPPQPVASVPLRWELASGGMTDAANLYGRGQEPDETGIIHMPQIEHPERPATTPSRPMPPMNMAPVPAWFPERLAKAGTRDQRWTLFRAPLQPKDFDPSMHNAAPLDQQAGNYPRGDEPITLINLHPTIPTFETSLPGLRPKVTLVRMNGIGEDVPMRLDTVILLPDDEQLVLLWRGNPAAADRQLSDYELVLAGVEGMHDPQVAVPDRIKVAEAKAAATRPKDDAAEMRKLEADGAAEVRTMLEKVDLPPALRATVNTETNPTKLFEALLGHVQSELKRLGHWKG